MTTTTTPSTESALPLWAVAWREGVAPCLTAAQLVILHAALEADSPELCQRATVKTVPPEDGLLPSACCALGYAVWKSGPATQTARDVRIAFDILSHSIRQQLRRAESRADLSDFLCFFDQFPRAEMRRLLLEEVERSIHARAGV